MRTWTKRPKAPDLASLAVARFWVSRLAFGRANTGNPLPGRCDMFVDGAGVVTRVTLDLPPSEHNFRRCHLPGQVEARPPISAQQRRMLDMLLRDPGRAGTGLPRKFSRDRVPEFLDGCSSAIGLAREGIPDATSGEFVDAATVVAKRAGELLEAMRRLPGSSFSAYRWATVPGIAIDDDGPYRTELSPDGGFLWHTYRTVESLERLSGHVAHEASQRVSKGKKASQAFAGLLVRGVAREFERTYGTLPSGAKGSWFVRFMAELVTCDGVTDVPVTGGVKCGQHLVIESIKDMKASRKAVSRG